RMTWAYIDDEPLFADCYAMNVCADAVWTCYYIDFPILRVGYTGSICRWKNRKCGARLIAVSDRNVVLFGGYNEQANLGSLLSLDTEQADTIGEFELDINGAPPREFTYSGARADAIHFVEGDKWYVLTVHDAMRALASPRPR